MGKPSAPAAPDYSPIAAADQQAAQQQFQLGEQQLKFGQNQFNQVWPYAQQYLQQQTENASDASQSAKTQQQYYDQTYKPIETKFADTASTYNSPARASENAGNAMADVASSFDTNRAAALSSLESYGIDPSQTRYGALDLGTRISQAAATAAAGTQSRLNTEATGMALEGEAINVGRGYPSSIAQSYQTATGAGAAGITGANQTTSTGVNAMGSPNSYFNGGTSAMTGATSALNTGFSNQMSGAQFNYTAAENTSQGIGQLIGGGLGLAAMFMM